ncbi:36472_t:CDS:2, partial [Racocetra persica]
YDISLSTNIIMSRIRRNEIPNVTLSRTDYDNYRQKFLSSLQQGVSFSNQLNLHEQLRIIKDENYFTTKFFTAAKIYTKIDSDSSLLDSDSELYTTDEHILQQSSSLNDDE